MPASTVADVSARGHTCHLAVHISKAKAETGETALMGQDNVMDQEDLE